MKGDLHIVKQGLQDRIHEVCERLLPDGRERGGQWESVNPITGDYRKMPALKVRVRGGELGAWIDWRAGVKGDVLGLVAYMLTGNEKNAKEALAWGRDFLGMARMTREDRAALQRSAAERKVEREKQEERRRRWKLASARDLFLKGTDPIDMMTPAEAHARLYFQGRGVPLEAVATLNRETFRFAAATEWWSGAEWKNEGGGKRFKVKEGPRFPAVHSGMRIWNGEVTACHCTFLDPSRPAKAPVDKAKLMWGEALGAVIEVACGWSKEPFWKADASQAAPLVVAEGIETALAWAVSVPDVRVWACGSLAGIAHAPIALPCVDWVLFARDNNEGNTAAQRQFERALHLLESHGKRIVVKASHVGDDFNDLITGEDE